MSRDPRIDTYIAALASLALLVSGCWTGKPFYAASQAQAPIAPGDYDSFQFEGDGEAGSPSDRETVRIEIQGDRLTRLTSLGKDGNPSTMGFVPFDRQGRLFLGWMQVETDDPKPDDDVTYFLLERGESDYRFLMPTCEDDGELAVAAGATIAPDAKVKLCRFPDRASLEAGMRAAIGRIHRGIRLVRRR